MHTSSGEQSIGCCASNPAIPAISRHLLASLRMPEGSLSEERKEPSSPRRPGPDVASHAADIDDTALATGHLSLHKRGNREESARYWRTKRQTYRGRQSRRSRRIRPG